MPFFDVQDGTGARLHYDVQSELVPENVFLIHGNLASNRWWEPSQSYFPRSSQNKGLLVSAEFRGCGKTSPPKDESEVDLHRFADDFIALIKQLGVGPFHLVGHSTGGLIAALMLSKAPELFKKAVLLDPVGAEGVKFDEAMVSAFEAMKKSRELTGVVIGSTIYQNDPADEYFQNVIVEDAFRAVKAVGHLVIKALDGFDVRKEVAKIKSPVLVLHGEHDRLLPVVDSQKLAALIPQGEFRTFVGQGHCGNLENPKAFVALVSKFLF